MTLRQQLGAPGAADPVSLATSGTLLVTPVAVIAALPIAVWEFSIGVWLVVKGFSPSPVTAGMGESGDPWH